jgi:uncharacterized protein
MTIIDVDSHFYEPFDWLEQTDPKLAAEIPPVDITTLLTTSIAGDLLASLPPELRPDPLTLLPERVKPLVDKYRNAPMSEIAKAVQELQGGSHFLAKGAYKAVDRLAFMDERGVDAQFILPTFAFRAVTAIKRIDPANTLRAIEAYNTWAAGATFGHSDRLMQSTMLDISNVDWAVRELTRTRALGSRSFSISATPQRGRSLAHADYDRLWSAATDLGMVTMMHVGGGRPTLDPGWSNSQGDFSELALLTFSQVHHVPQIALNAMIFGGVFERHPKLNVIVAEYGVGWAPFWLRNLETVTQIGLFKSALDRLRLAPIDYAKRQVKFTPLPDMDVADLIRGVGEDMVVFSSDYPHPEGSADAVSHYRAALKDFSPATQGKFFGATTAALLAA